MTARFISFEGTEGVGKTTLLTAFAEHLRAHGIKVLTTREPGGSPFAERLRALLLDPATSMADDSELLLMFAARADHLAQTILPALAAGSWVLCDRFVDSSVAYQGFGRKHGDAETLAKIHALSKQFVPRLPDCTIWLDLPVAQGMARAKRRADLDTAMLDRFEQQQLAFFERVYQGFAYCQTHAPKRIQRIDATGDTEAVLARIIAALP
ncbi:dTMP kinase [Moraxella atlantae]|uniref:dTMP kinase n=1 Tax=Faucicola atlantae TaxID=34059 RepID=UPI003753161A